MSDQPLKFYFDYISNNAYLAWTQLPRLEQEYGITVRPVPVLFAGLLAANNQLGPAEVPPKAKWMGRNVLRKAALLGVPISPPKHHPYNPLLSLRISSLDLEPAARGRLIDGLFRAVWVDRMHISDPTDVANVVAEAGLDPQELIAAANGADAKARLRRQTDDAIGRGVFGVPSMIVADELFFGYDDFPYMEMVIRGEDPLDAESLRRWQNAQVTPSAMRRQVSDRK